MRLNSTASSRKVGDAVRLFRQKANMTGVQLGQKAGISQSKVSKIEAGLLPVDSDIVQKILNILHAPLSIRQQIKKELTASQDSSQLTQFIFEPLQIDMLTIQGKAKSIHVFTLTGIPILLQTISYRSALLHMGGVGAGIAAERLTSMNQRQDMLWRSNQRYQILFHEPVLYSVITTLPEHCAQLDRIDRMLGYDSPSVGILPSTAGGITLQTSNLVIYDDAVAYGEVGLSEVEYTDPTQLSQLRLAFDDIAVRSVYGNAARTLVQNARRHVSDY